MVREGSTYYWDRRLFHLSAAFIIPLLGLAVGYEYARAMAIIGTVVLVGGEATRLLIPSVNAWFIEWLGMLLKPGEEHKVTAATYLVVTSLVMLLVFDLEIAALALLFWRSAIRWRASSASASVDYDGIAGSKKDWLPHPVRAWKEHWRSLWAATASPPSSGQRMSTSPSGPPQWPPLWSSSQYRWKTTQRFLSPVAWSCGCCGSVNRHNQPHTEALNAQDYTR
jgi:hypothetical protein